MRSIHETRNPSFQLIQMLQPRQDNLLTCLFNLSCQENLIQYRVDLILTVSYRKVRLTPYLSNPPPFIHVLTL